GNRGPPRLPVLLPVRKSRPRGRRTAEQRDELAALHSITSSARARNDSGIVRPIAFAVLRLMTSSNFVGCSTGMSFGCLPCKIFCTSLVAWRNAAGPSAPNDIRPPMSANARVVEAIGKRYLMAIEVRDGTAKLP